MNTIKFSHIYNKLLDEHNDVIDEALLLDVIPVNLEERSEVFIKYDTDNGKYSLPKKGKYLMLIFMKPPELSGICADNIFTTLRRYTHEKTAYYKGHIGETFVIEIAHLSAIEGLKDTKEE